MHRHRIQTHSSPFINGFARTPLGPAIPLVTVRIFAKIPPQLGCGCAYGVVSLNTYLLRGWRQHAKDEAQAALQPGNPVTPPASSKPGRDFGTGQTLLDQRRRKQADCALTGSNLWHQSLTSCSTGARNNCQAAAARFFYELGQVSSRFSALVLDQFFCDQNLKLHS